MRREEQNGHRGHARDKAAPQSEFRAPPLRQLTRWVWCNKSSSPSAAARSPRRCRSPCATSRRASCAASRRARRSLAESRPRERNPGAKTRGIPPSEEPRGAGLPRFGGMLLGGVAVWHTHRCRGYSNFPASAWPALRRGRAPPAFCVLGASQAGPGSAAAAPAAPTRSKRSGLALRFGRRGVEHGCISRCGGGPRGSSLGAQAGSDFGHCRHAAEGRFAGPRPDVRGDGGECMGGRAHRVVAAPCEAGQALSWSRVWRAVRRRRQ